MTTEQIEELTAAAERYATQLRDVRLMAEDEWGQSLETRVALKAVLARLADLERLREAVEKLSSLDLVSENTAWNLAYTEMIAALAKLNSGIQS